MLNRFTIMNQHVESPRERGLGGRLVFSRLPAGRSVLGASTPSLKIVLEGEGYYEVDGRTVCVRPGQFLYLDAGADCTISHRSDLVGICLMLPSDVSLDAPLRSGMGDEPTLGRALVLSTASSAMGRILEARGRQIARDPRLGHLVADEMIRQADQAVREPIRESRAAMEGLKVVKASTRRALFERLERARGFLHRNDDRNVTLGELAAEAGLSQFHLARYFKLAFGVAPIAYHRTLRLERAARLLSSESRSLIQVAELTGYSDEVALSHAFRRHYGRPPQLWAMERRAS